MSLLPHPISDDQFRRLVGTSYSDAVSSHPDDRRRFKRFAVRINLTCRSLNHQWEPTGKVIEGVTLNMSRAGVLFDTTSEIPADFVRVKFIRDDEVLAERVVRIDRRTPAHGAAVVAGAFVEIPIGKQNQKALQ